VFIGGGNHYFPFAACLCLSVLLSNTPLPTQHVFSTTDSMPQDIEAFLCFTDEIKINIFLYFFLMDEAILFSRWYDVR
jgi:hypothetical protein